MVEMWVEKSANVVVFHSFWISIQKLYVTSSQTAIKRNQYCALDKTFILHKAIKQPYTSKPVAEPGIYQGCLTPSAGTHH